MNYFIPMSKSKYFWMLFIIVVCIFVGVVWNIERKIQQISLHTDEISWFFHIDAFEQLFIKKDITSEFWQSYESYDHPPLVKYIYGAYAWGRDPRVFEKRDILEKKWGRWEIYSNPATTKEGFVDFGPHIRRMREINLLALFGALVGFFLLLTHLGGVSPFIALLGTLILAYNPLYLQEMTHATSDAYMISFFVWAIVFYTISFQRKSIGFMYVSFVLAAYSVASKLTGGIAIVAMLSYEVVRLMLAEERRKNIFVRMVLLVCVIVGLWIIVNPTLYRAPLQNSVHYATFRIGQTQRLIYFERDAALTSIEDKVRASWCTLVQRNCNGFFEKGSITAVSGLNIALVLGGVWYIAYQFRRVHRKLWLISIVLFVSIVWNMLFLPLHYGRYYLPIQIGVFFISTCGLEIFRLYILSILKNKTPVFRRGIFDKTS